MNDRGRRLPMGTVAIGCGLAIWMALPASGDGSGSADRILEAKGLRRVGGRSSCRKRRTSSGESSGSGGRSRDGSAIAGGSRMSSRPWTDGSGSTVNSRGRGTNPIDSTGRDTHPATPGRRTVAWGHRLATPDRHRGSRCSRGDEVRVRPETGRIRTIWGTSARAIRGAPAGRGPGPCRSPQRGSASCRARGEDDAQPDLRRRPLGPPGGRDASAPAPSRGGHGAPKPGPHSICRALRRSGREAGSAALNGTSTATVTLGPVTVGNEDLRPIDASLGQAIRSPSRSGGSARAGGTEPPQGPGRGGRSAAARGGGRNRTARDARARPPLAEEDTGRAGSQEPQTLGVAAGNAGGRRAIRADLDPTQEPADSHGEPLIGGGAARIARAEVRDRLASHQELFLRIIGIAREAVEQAGQDRNGPDGVATARSSDTKAAKYTAPSMDPTVEPYAREIEGTRDGDPLRKDGRRLG